MLRREALSGRLPAIATLLVPLSLLGQGCETQRTGKPVEPVKSPAATVESEPALAEASAPTADEGSSSGAPREETRQADRPAAPPERTPEAEPVEASEVTDASFAEFTAKGVAIVDFWSPTCPPCRAQGPIVEKLANDFAGRAAIGKLRVDLNREAARRFRIMYIPTLVVLRDGQEVKRFTGLQSKATLVAALEEALGGE